jgi:4a-hydroxytetrahydrobiopterin dehydratase
VKELPLHEQHCVPCEAVARLDPIQEASYLQKVPSWRLHRGSPDHIVREVELENFRKATFVISLIAELANAEYHHPRLYLHNARYLSIELSTYAVSGLSINDFILAAKIDETVRQLTKKSKEPMTYTLSTEFTQNELRKGHCVPCEGSEAQLTIELEDQYLHSVPEWTIDRSTVHRITREIEAKNFMAAVSLLNKVAAIAESEGHHPNFSIYGYKYLKIELYTHAIKGLSMNDFILAVKIDELLNA